MGYADLTSLPYPEYNGTNEENSVCVRPGEGLCVYHCQLLKDDSLGSQKCAFLHSDGNAGTYLRPRVTYDWFERLPAPFKQAAGRLVNWLVILGLVSLALFIVKVYGASTSLSINTKGAQAGKACHSRNVLHCVPISLVTILSYLVPTQALKLHVTTRKASPRQPQVLRLSQAAPSAPARIQRCHPRVRWKVALVSAAFLVSSQVFVNGALLVPTSKYALQLNFSFVCTWCIVLKDGLWIVTPSLLYRHSGCSAR